MVRRSHAAVHQRLLLTHESVAALPPAATRYVVTDTKLSGFRCIVRKKAKLLVFQAEQREGGKRRLIYKRLGALPHVRVDEARAAALEELARLARLTKPEARAGMTFAEAWDEYRARLEKRRDEGKASQRTVDDYTQKYTHNLARLHKRALRDITRADARRLHTDLSDSKGKYSANGSLRVAHAVFRYAATELEVPLPTANPFRPRDLFHKEMSRQTGMSESDLPAWFGQVLALDNSATREFNVMAALTGLRRHDLLTMRHADVREDRIMIPSPKGGEPSQIPLTTAMRRSLDRVKRAGKMLPERCHEWVFPSAASKSGHLEEVKHRDLDRSPHALRHTFRGMCAGAGVAELHSKLLMLHSVGGDVHRSYATVPALFAQLATASEAVSTYILRHLPKGAERQLERRLREQLAGADLNQSRQAGHKHGSLAA
jgi:integrase